MKDIIYLLKDRPVGLLLRAAIFALIYYIPLVIWAQPKWWTFPALYLLGLVGLFCAKCQAYIMQKYP